MSQLSRDWAVKIDGLVGDEDYSSKYYAQQASASATSASSSASTATSAKNNAQTSATNASNSATLAQQWATKTDGKVDSTDYSAKYYALSCIDSATSASQSATSAASSASTATTKASEASTSASTATTKASEASSSATNANNSATLAQNWATKTNGTVDENEYSSKYYAQQAHASQTSASASATSASNSATTATTKATEANTSAASALSSKESAEDSADLSRDWATKMNGKINNEDYSSKYYAGQAQTAASTAAQDAASTAATQATQAVQSQLAQYVTDAGDAADRAEDALDEIDTILVDGGYLPVTGGTINGDLTVTGTMSSGGSIMFMGANNRNAGIDLNNNGTNFDIGWNWANKDGAGFYLRSTDFSGTAGGGFGAYARNATKSYDLFGNPNGSLTWNGTSFTVGSGTGTITGNITGNVLTGYTKPSATSALAATDTLNGALGKLEKALDGKSNTSHTHSYLPLAGGTLTGAVNGVTPTAGDNSTKLATTAYVQNELSAYSTTTDWADITNKPSFATVSTTGSYNDLTNKPTIPTVPSAMTASEASTGTSTTARTITAKVLSDLINARISAITDGDGVSY